MSVKPGHPLHPLATRPACDDPRRPGRPGQRTRHGKDSESTTFADVICLSPSSVYHTLYARRCPSNIVIINIHAAADSYFIRHSRSRSLPRTLLRGMGIKHVPGFSTAGPASHLALCLLHRGSKTANPHSTGKGVFLATIRGFFHATCHAEYAQPERILAMRNTLPRPIGSPIPSLEA